MGHKKRNAAPRAKASPAEVSADGVKSSVEREQKVNSNSAMEEQEKSKIEGSVVESGASSYSAIKLECERALTALRRGNHTKALRLMKDMFVKHESSAHAALIHRVQGSVCVQLASIIDDPNAKQRHFKNAIGSAKQAVSLSPNSIEFAHFYAKLLYEVANEYEEVVQECERALAIENPVDPAKESLLDESQQKISTADARIGHVQGELRSLIEKSLIEKSNRASISTWIKSLESLGGGVRLISKIVPADPMVQARRPNEIKKATKTPEERRKEIEVRVAAARLLQQKSDSPQSQNDVSKTLDSSSGSGAHRMGERRKSGNMKRSASTAERKDWVRSYWNAVSLDMKKDLLRIKTSALKAHFSSRKDNLANEVISEAMSFAEANGTWKFWLCYRCSEIFSDSESHMQHVLQEHMRNLLPEMQSMLPQNVDNEWIDMLLNSSWKPLDVNAAAKMVQNKLKAPEFLGGSYPNNDTEECKDCPTDNCCSEDALDMSSPKEKIGDGRNVDCVESLECKHYDKVCDIRWKDLDGNQGGKANFPPESWPVSDDNERAKVLEKIHNIFQVLINHKYLAASHLNKVMQYTVDELQGLASGSQLLNYGIDQTPTCICFLGASELRKVLKYLQELSHSCGIGRYSEKSGATDGTGRQVAEIMEKIVLNEDASCFILDELFFPCKLPSPNSHNSTTNDAVGPISSDVGYGNQVLLDTDALLSWIFMGPTSGEQLVTWTRMKEEKKQQGMEVLQMLHEDLSCLQSMCRGKCEHLSYKKAVQAVEDLCLEEGKKRENGSEFVCQSLRKRKEDLTDGGSSSFELDAISNILKEAESLNGSRFPFEESYGGVTSRLCDLESGEEDDWRMKDYLHQVDSCIEVAIQRQKEQLATELSKLDARMMQNLSGMQQMEVKLELVSAYDYQSILLPLIKSFLRAHLEDLAAKDATEKSDAVREAFLAELALDSKKSSGGGIDNSKYAHENTKDKRKNKENRKSKNAKATGGNVLMLHHEIVESASSPDASSGDHLDSEILVSVCAADALKQEEEEFRRRMELEEEERKLEETLEYQRRMENEAKLKHLAQQHKKTTRTTMEMPSDDDQALHEQFKHCKQERLAQKSEFPNGLEGVVKPIDGAVHRNSNFHGHHHTKVKQGKQLSCKASDFEVTCSFHSSWLLPPFIFAGLPNGGISEMVFHRGQLKKVDIKIILPSWLAQRIKLCHLRRRILKLEKLNLWMVFMVTTMSRQSLVEEDDEERFQADLKKAVHQSLVKFSVIYHVYTIHTKLFFQLWQISVFNRITRCLTDWRLHKMSSEMDDFGIAVNEAIPGNVDRAGLYGTGLKNEVGEYNCFLNVIIQSLWHVSRFRDEFLGRSLPKHVHVGDPCVTCALYDIFTALSTASTDLQRETVAPTSLRSALSNLYPDSNFFQQAQMNDASEVLGVIFDCLHRSFTSSFSISDTESVESSCTGSWDCLHSACIAHSLFGMDIFERMNCYNCGLESRRLKYTSFFHNINASALRTMKVMCEESSFDELLNLVEVSHQLACDPEAGGCGKLNYIHHNLSSPPHVFITVLGWQNTCESKEDITSTLASLNTEIDVGVLYRGLDLKNKHCLVSVVCYYGQHYHCFAYSHNHEQWVMYDDKTVKVIGGWDDVLTMCERGHLQPQVLFFEAVN
ncbi:uncharacterized protein LOC127794247 [Diospyros lotus]|uniref:uncharacterized protein LOC127794247 n=1 Tax=Diospyros lotus TaxID=55363 RepID=UPI00225A5716|nr:uncharacterized protein LOC127794247 [Diospyros lotus]